MSALKSSISLSNPWLGKPWVDLLFIIAPPFLCLAFIALFPQLFQDVKEIPVYWWVILILLIDVAHVYSTLFRTYFSKTSWQRYGTPMTIIPLASFLFGVMLCSMSMALFWTVMAYIAVFHFIRQQYGIMKLYSRTEGQVPDWCKWIDVITVYTATVYPILYWHFSSARNFNWFVEGDFILKDLPGIRMFFTVLYIAIVAVYVIKELFLILRFRTLNILRILVITGTLFSWYMGIVYFNGDLAFTLLNVVSHGIPYMALIWIFSMRENIGESQRSSFWKLMYGPVGIFLFLVIIFVFAFLEEGLWDTWVWKDNGKLFAVFSDFKNERLSSSWLKFVVPLLAVPQLTHYVIDGFIWRKKVNTQGNTFI